MGGIGRVEMQRPIPRIENGQGEVGSSFLRSHQQLHLAAGIHINAKTMPAPIGHGLLKGCCGRVQAVGGADRIVHGIGHAPKNILRRAQIRGSQREVD